MALNVEGIVEGAIGGNETLGLALGFESLHFPQARAVSQLTSTPRSASKSSTARKVIVKRK